MVSSFVFLTLYYSTVLFPKVSSNSLDSYKAFMKVFEQGDNGSKEQGCLVGEFEFSVLGGQPAGYTEAKNPLYTIFFVKFNTSSVDENLQVYREASNALRKYTPSCYVQIHHLSTYYEEFQDNAGEFSRQELSFLMLLGEVSIKVKSNEINLPLKYLHVSPTFLILYYQKELKLSDNFKSEIVKFLASLDFFGTEYAFLKSFKLNTICFICHKNYQHKSYRYKMIGYSNTINGYARIKNLVRSSPQFPNLKRVSMSQYPLAFKSSSLRDSELSYHCSKPYFYQRWAFRDIIPCLYVILANYFNFTLTYSRESVKTATLRFETDNYRNLQNWYRNRIQPINEREMYCSHSFLDYRFKLFVRRDRSPISLTEALKLPFDLSTWLSILTTLSLTFALVWMVQKCYITICNESLSWNIGEIFLFIYMTWLLQGTEAFVKSFRNVRVHLGYLFIILILLMTTLANLYSGIAISFFTVTRLPTLPKTIFETTKEEFLSIPVVTISRFRPILSELHNNILQTAIDKMEETSEMYEQSQNLNEYRELMKRILMAPRSHGNIFDFFINSTFKEVMTLEQILGSTKFENDTDKLMLYDYTEVETSFKNVFGIVDRRYQIDILSTAVAVTGIYEKYAEQQLYSQDFEQGRLPLNILNKGKFLKSRFHSALAWIDNTGIYSRFATLDCQWNF